MSSRIAAEQSPPGISPATAAGHPGLSSANAPIDLRHLIPPGASAVMIEHEGQRYTLRLTRTNKLILTK